MHKETRITFKSFKKIKNPELKGSECSFCKQFIGYQDICYRHPQIKIYCCQKCFTSSSVKKLKYHNQPTEYKGGLYDSKLEVKYVQTLELLKQTGQIKDYKPQFKIELNVKYVNNEPILTIEPIKELKDKGIKAKHLTNYYIDFVITNNDDSIKYVETKGFETQLWRLKFSLLEAIIRDAEIEVVKEKQLKIKRAKDSPSSD